MFSLFQFSKDGGKYIEEDKLKVALISPLNSPILSPTDGELDEIMDGIVKPSGKSGPLRDGLATNEIPKPKYQNGASDEMLPSGVSTLRPSNEGMTHEASRLKDDFVASKGGQPIEASKPSDQNGELREEVLLHQTSRLKDQNGISKEEIPREALKPRDQNGSSKEEELTLEAPKKRVQNGALEGQGYETSHLKDPLSSGSVIQPPEYVAVRKNFLIYTELKFSSLSLFNNVAEGSNRCFSLKNMMLYCLIIIGLRTCWGSLCNLFQIP